MSPILLRYSMGIEVSKGVGEPLTVYAFLKRNRGEGFCDRCVQNATGVERRQVNIIAATLSLFPAEFLREEKVCPQGCGNVETEVTMAV